MCNFPLVLARISNIFKIIVHFFCSNVTKCEETIFQRRFCTCAVGAGGKLAMKPVFVGG